MYRTLFHTYWPRWSAFERNVLLFILAAVIALVICFYIMGWTKKRCAAFFALAIYLCFVFGSTVFARAPRKSYSYELELFWSYRKVIANPESPLKREIFLNYLLLAPYGFLAPVAAGAGRAERKGAGRHRGRKGICLMVIVTGCLISCMIEGLQLFLKRGLFELDDILNNTLGVAGGYVMYCAISFFCDLRRGQKKAEFNPDGKAP